MERHSNRGRAVLTALPGSVEPLTAAAARERQRDGLDSSAEWRGVRNGMPEPRPYKWRGGDADCVAEATERLDAIRTEQAAGLWQAISDEEFEAAKVAALARWGYIPPSLQKVIDSGGRFGLAGDR